MKSKHNPYKYAALGTLMLISTAITLPVFGQGKPADPQLKIYRATPDKINNLVHTKLNVKFDYKKRHLYGEEWVTLQPHFYATDSLRLDAKGMDIKELALFNKGKKTPLKYTYDNLTLNIRLDKTYQKSEKYTLYIAYTAKPDELQLEAGAAITDAKGLYFINPDSTEKGKPVQIWTQGELESSSAWFPTIDHTNQKTTQEISMTVPAKYVTLSNGRLDSQKKNADGTRTDTWKMELPHSPYLFMMAVGDFKIYKDKWKDKEVNYYLEPAYAPYAKDIFGFTPEVMDFYSQILGVDYPWNKYAQIVVRDYVSGAMENTTATLHGDYVQGTARELADRYYDKGRSTIVHELFHQWFGDYVTAESWSNLTVNESFADLSETLWAEHKYGQDAGDAHNYDAMQSYLSDPGNEKKDLVRFHYHNSMDMFDGVSYQKGGRVLNMLRNYLGKEAFYKGLGLYLKTNAFKNGEAHQLRLALEEVSGKDLNWFFNQWYFGAGHPLLDIKYNWDEQTKTQQVILTQSQQGDAFRLPMAIDIYSGGKKIRKQVWMNDKTDTLSWKLDRKPDLVNVDGDKILLTKKSDHKTLAEFWFQYQNAGLYVDRLEAIEAAKAASKDQDPTAEKILIAALQDKYYELRIQAIEAITPGQAKLYALALPELIKTAQKDENNLVRAAAIRSLYTSEQPEKYKEIYQEALKSSSYAIIGAGLEGTAILDKPQALQLAKNLEKDSKGNLTKAIVSIYGISGGDSEWPFVYQNFINADPQSKFDMFSDFINIIAAVKSPEYAGQGIRAIKDFGIKYKAHGVAPKIIQILQQLKPVRTGMNDQASADLIDQSVKELEAKP